MIEFPTPAFSLNDLFQLLLIEDCLLQTHSLSGRNSYRHREPVLCTASPVPAAPMALLVSWYCLWKWVLAASWEKAFWGNHKGEWGLVVRFMREAKSKGCLSNVPSLFVLPWKIRARNTGNVQRSWAMARLVRSSLSHRQASSACSPGCTPLLCWGIQGPPWSLHVESMCGH